MENRNRSHRCVCQCPCYPRCDEMMEQGDGMGTSDRIEAFDEPKEMEGSERREEMMRGRGEGREEMTGGREERREEMMRDREERREEMMGDRGERREEMMGNRGERRREERMQERSDRRGMQMPWQNVRIGSDMEMEDEQDWERLKEMFPEIARIIQSEVERVCDRMEYEGSAMFDQMPDPNRMRKLAEEISMQVSNRISTEEAEEPEDLFTMNRQPCRNCRPDRDFLRDFAQTLLFHEIHRRRCRNRRCRRW